MALRVFGFRLLESLVATFVLLQVAVCWNWRRLVVAHQTYQTYNTPNAKNINLGQSFFVWGKTHVLHPEFVMFGKTDRTALKKLSTSTKLWIFTCFDHWKSYLDHWKSYLLLKQNGRHGGVLCAKSLSQSSPFESRNPVTVSCLSLQLLSILPNKLLISTPLDSDA